MLTTLVGTGLFLALMAGLFIPLEGWFARERWAPGGREVAICVALLVVDVMVMEAVGGAILDGIRAATPTSAAPTAIRVVIVLVLAECAGYWIHRAMHRVPWLWRLHAVHHAPAKLHWLAAWRQHPIDFLLHGIAVGLPGALLDASLADLTAVVLLRKTYTTFLHANLRWRLAWLEPWIATPALHRVHHSADPREFDRNFAGMLPIIDQVFGTYARPRG